MVELSTAADASGGRYRLMNTRNALAVTLFLLRSTHGVDILNAMIEEADRA